MSNLNSHSREKNLQGLIYTLLSYCGGKSGLREILPLNKKWSYLTILALMAFENDIFSFQLFE